ncbi:C-type lectin domain family 1 member B-like isoform X2 [Microcebus murinus]|uniref:C-type lectin domain family 1 member B-like isoform X2 n=1 Tax=Microcebus murinus TaxID=30608 RepID=UPI003F6BFA1D
MSTTLASEQPPEITEETETIPIVDLEPPPDLPPVPPPLEDEWEPIPKNTNVNASASSCSLHGIITVALSIFSLLLLLLCGLFAYQYFQSVQASESKMKSLNQWIESFQNKAENFLQVPKVLDQNKGNRCGPSLNNWVQYMDHCYHKTVDMVPWLSCSDLCVSLNATFLKTERSGLVNIMKLLLVSQTWIGLSYKEKHNEWKWEDGSSTSPGLGLPEPKVDFQGKCVYLDVHDLGIDDCTTSSSCMCEKAVCAKSSEKEG